MAAISIITIASLNCPANIFRAFLFFFCSRVLGPSSERRFFASDEVRPICSESVFTDNIGFSKALAALDFSMPESFFSPLPPISALMRLGVLLSKETSPEKTSSGNLLSALDMAQSTMLVCSFERCDCVLICGCLLSTAAFLLTSNPDALSTFRYPPCPFLQ